jgi:hypothetical protein
MSNNIRSTAIALFIVVATFMIIAGLLISQISTEGATRWSLTQVAEAAHEGHIERIVVATNAEDLEITLDDGTAVISSKDPNSTVFDQLTMLGVTSEELAAIEWETDAIPFCSRMLAVLRSLFP